MTIYALGAHVPDIDPESWIAPDAVVIGKVHLAKNVSVWWNCTLRGDTDHLYVGENTNIQDGSVLHTDAGIQLIVGSNVTIGHRVILHGCTIGDGSLIGMGATVLNRAVVGKNCLIGANTLIPEGKAIPDRSLVVGAPGRIVRQLTDEELLHIRRGNLHYVENARHYRQELREIQAPTPANDQP